MRPLRIFTWHVHGNYLYYLSQAPHEFYIPKSREARAGYGGRGPTFAFGANVHEIPEEQVPEHEFDLVLFQHRRNWAEDQYRTLSERQRRLPRIHLEHDPPQEHPTNTRHFIDDPGVLVVHVTPFNALMWDNGRTPVRVIEHGVLVPEDVRWTGEVARGIAVVNHMMRRGRRLGADVFEALQADAPIDLAGLESEATGGLGEVHPMRLAAFESRYRFFFDPVRWTSLSLALCEAMMLGMPVVALATTEKAAVIDDGINGIADTRPDRLLSMMQELISDAALARRLGAAARATAMERFGIARFLDDWCCAFSDVTGMASAPHAPLTAAAG
jgi:hypothetical protein